MDVRGHFGCVILLISPLCFKILLGILTLFLFRNTNNLAKCKEIIREFLKNYAA